MQFFFHFRNGTHSIVDKGGIDYDDRETVQVEAARALEEFRAEVEGESLDWNGWCLEITDAAGATVTMISLDARG